MPVRLIAVTVRQVEAFISALCDGDRRSLDVLEFRNVRKGWIVDDLQRAHDKHEAMIQRALVFGIEAGCKPGN